MNTTHRSNPATRLGFTLVELLVVIGIIAVLISILLPSLNRARQSARALQCQSNLKQLGIAAVSYVSEYKNTIFYPTTTFGEAALWFNAVDPYLQARRGREGATGVAAGRSYRSYKQCVHWLDFGEARQSGGQDNVIEFARFFKMNSMLRRNNVALRPNPVNPAVNTTYSPARITDVKKSAQHVLIGDGVSLDSTGLVASQFESGQFSMEVNDITQANPSLRHRGAANILFVDAHVEAIKDIPRIRKPLRSPQNALIVDSWEGEYRDASGALFSPPAGEARSAQQLGLVRNGNMPLIWSDLGKLYR